MIKILFVCHGNICRSTMAEFYMKEIVRRAGLSGEIEVASAATTNDEAGNDTYYATKDVLTEKGIPFTSRRAVKMTKDDYNTYDYIIVFDEENIRGVERITGLHDAKKVYTLLTFAGEDRDIARPVVYARFSTDLPGCGSGMQRVITLPSGSQSRFG